MYKLFSFDLIMTSKNVETLSRFSKFLKMISSYILSPVFFLYSKMPFKIGSFKTEI